MKTMIETDCIGSMELSAGFPHGIHSQRALSNFPVPGQKVPASLINALLLTKKACALANRELGFFSKEKGNAIVEACDNLETIDCPLSALQGGAGTSTNMYVNERIARAAGAGIHPIEDVNLHQSTNDVYPTSLKVAATFELRKLANAAECLQGVFQQLEKRFADVVVIGRTELVEAVPITLGAQFGAFGEAMARDRWRTFKCEERLRVVNLGGTAVGTGLTAPRSYVFLAVEKLREVTGLGLSRGENLVDQTANADAFVEVSGMLKACSANLQKICGDLRLLQMQGIIRLPAVQAGSSIMPGKVNPVILESVMQIAIKVQANDFIVTECASRGSLQINEFMPLLAASLLESIELLECACQMLARHVAGIEANTERCGQLATESLAIVTAFLPEIGYDRATGLVDQFKQTGRADFRAYLAEQLGSEMVERTLSPQNLMALGYR